MRRLLRELFVTLDAMMGGDHRSGGHQPPEHVEPPTVGPPKPGEPGPAEPPRLPHRVFE